MKLTDQTKVSIFSAACLLGLVVVLKNFLRVPAEILLRDIVLYIIYFSAFSIVFPSLEEKSKWNKPLYWYLVIIITTVAIIAVYAL